MCQYSFRTEEIFDGIDLRKYERADWSLIDDEDKTLKLKKEAKEKGWDVINVVLTA